VPDCKRLALLRHAKSSWAHPDIADHERRLNARGRRDAARVGVYLRQEGIAPDLVLCSSAVRTRETLGLLGLLAPEVLVEDDLYGASVAELIGRLRRVGDPADSVLLVGHNPGIEDLAGSLAAEPERLTSFPTAALADLWVPIAAWDELRPGVAAINAFVTPSALD
jgi:phosphohistidine phosphatase